MRSIIVVLFLFMSVLALTAFLGIFKPFTVNRVIKEEILTTQDSSVGTTPSPQILENVKKEPIAVNPVVKEKISTPQNSSGTAIPSPKTLENAKKEEITVNCVIKGKIFTTQDYCGGAAPSPQILENLKKEQLADNQLFCIKKWSDDFLTQPVLQEFTTTENGTFTVTLPKGKYGIFTKEKTQDFSKGIMAKFGNSPKCKEWQNTPDIALTVAKKSKKIETFRFHRKCNPCTPPRP